MPREFPAWAAVYDYFYKWAKDGLNHTLRAVGCGSASTSLDSQSVQCTAVPGVRGFDAGKKINKHQRHLLVDTLRLLLVAVVTTANVQGGCC